MTKILSISDGILINKDNVQQSITTTTKYIGQSNELTFTYNGTANTEALILVDGRDSDKNGLILVLYDTDYGLQSYVLNGTLTTTISNKTITIFAGWWSHARVVDFAGNSWA